MCSGSIGMFRALAIEMGRHMIREEIPRWIMTGVTFVLSIILALFSVDFLHVIVRVYRGMPVLIALLTMIPVLCGTFVFDVLLARRYKRYHMSGVLPLKFSVTTAVQLFVWVFVRVGRVLVVGAATTSQTMTAAQLFAIFGDSYLPITLVLFVSALAFVVCSVIFGVQGPRNPYGLS